MKRYAIYATTTGAILRIVQCPPGQSSLQAAAGEAVIEAPADVTELTHKVVGGALVPLA